MAMCPYLILVCMIISQYVTHTCVCCHRAREYKADNLRKENERIMAKERIEGGLTQVAASIRHALSS